MQQNLFEWMSRRRGGGGLGRHTFALNHKEPCAGCGRMITVQESPYGRPGMWSAHYDMERQLCKMGGKDYRMNAADLREE